jgi:hypothetical protein
MIPEIEGVGEGGVPYYTVVNSQCHSPKPEIPPEDLFSS